MKIAEKSQLLDNMSNSNNQNTRELASLLKEVYEKVIRIDDYGSWSEFIDEDGIVLLRTEGIEDGGVKFNFGGDEEFVQKIPGFYDEVEQKEHVFA